LYAGINTDIVVNKEINNSEDISGVDDDLFKPIKDSDIKDMVWN